MSLDDVKHVEAYAIIKRLVDRPDLEARDAALVWLGENHPPMSAYVAAAGSLGVVPPNDLTRDAGGVAPELEEEPCERCGGTKVDPAGATPGASCSLCCDEDWPFDEDPPDPL